MVFADGYPQLLEYIGTRRYPTGPGATLAKFVIDCMQFSSDDVVRHRLLFQRTIPGFEPSAESYALALEFLTLGSERWRPAGVRDPADVDVFTALVPVWDTSRSPTIPGANAGCAKPAGSSSCS